MLVHVHFIGGEGFLSRFIVALCLLTIKLCRPFFKTRDEGNVNVERSIYL